jgi:hypothetical protein
LNKILRNGNELVLGEGDGWLEVFAISSATIMHSTLIKEHAHINDIVAIGDSHFLLASKTGLLKSTNDQMTAQYY